MSLHEEIARNEALKATLAGLKAPKAAAAAPVSEAQKKAAHKMQIIEKEGVAFKLQQEIDRIELEVKHKLAEAKELKQKLKSVSTDIAEMKNAGAAVWESTGYATVSYKDPFHTGLPKRTPTGAPRRRAAAACSPRCRVLPRSCPPARTGSRHVLYRARPQAATSPHKLLHVAGEDGLLGCPLQANATLSRRRPAAILLLSQRPGITRTTSAQRPAARVCTMQHRQTRQSGRGHGSA
jgi:hypothetical protein